MSKGGLIVSFRPPRCARIAGIGPICVCFVFSLLFSIEAFSVFLLKGMGHFLHTFPFAFFSSSLSSLEGEEKTFRKSKAFERTSSRSRTASRASNHGRDDAAVSDLFFFFFFFVGPF